MSVDDVIRELAKDITWAVRQVGPIWHFEVIGSYMEQGFEMDVIELAVKIALENGGIQRVAAENIAAEYKDEPLYVSGTLANVTLQSPYWNK